MGWSWSLDVLACYQVCIFSNKIANGARKHHVYYAVIVGKQLFATSRARQKARGDLREIRRESGESPSKK